MSDLTEWQKGPAFPEGDITNGKESTTPSESWLWVRREEAEYLARIEALARDMAALDKGGFTNVDAWEVKYEALKAALASGGEG